MAGALHPAPGTASRGTARASASALRRPATAAGPTTFAVSLSDRVASRARAYIRACDRPTLSYTHMRVGGPRFGHSKHLRPPRDRLPREAIRPDLVGGKLWRLPVREIGRHT
eukprot:scaffold6249_cov395-Prasinococcus_capsulatus_cf.AAC.6